MVCFVFFKQKTAYEMRISDWSSDVCSSDLRLLHRAALGYLSDLTIQESILRAHGIAWSFPGLKVASLDHAMWWHRDARVDDWLLYVQESPSARGGRGLATGRIYTRAGVLAASVGRGTAKRRGGKEGGRTGRQGGRRDA